MTSQHAELLINRGSRRSRAVEQQIKDLCQANGLIIDAYHAVTGSNLDQTLRSIKKRDPKLLIVGSGDGTLSHLVNYFAGSQTVLGVIPLGTTNNFARSLALPLEIEPAIKQIAEGAVKPIDLGYLKKTYFANVAGIGISATIANSVDDAKKRRYGRLAYALEGLKQFIRHRPFMVNIKDKDGELQLNFETHQVIVANGRYHAGQEIAIDATLASRQLIIFALGGRSKLSFILAMLDFYLGKRKRVKHASYLIAKDVHIETSTRQPIELDGEVKFKTPCDIAVRPKAINIKGAA